MTLSPTFLIYRSGFAPTNGHSVQMQRLFGDAGDSVVHLMWDALEAGPRSVPLVINTDDHFGWKRPFARLDRQLRPLRQRLGGTWWSPDGRLNSDRLTSALTRLPLQPRQAYINFYAEGEAAKAATLWQAVGQPPYVLHIVDILDPELSETKTPNAVRLIRAASHVLCLNQLIETEMRRFGAVATSLFPLCSDLLPEQRKTVPPSPLKIITSGALYANVASENIAMRLLCSVWPELKRAFPGVELHYSGVSGRALPEELAPFVHNHGLLPVEKYQELLRSCHVAYVPVSHLNSSTLRFSLPSRIPDYLISGIPVIACTNERTGIHEFFTSSPRECTRLVTCAEEFLSAMREFAGDAPKWEKASHTATSFSEKTFAVQSARDKLFAYLNAAGASSG